MRHGWFRRGVRGIAQLVEQWSPKPRAEGSNPSAPAIYGPVVQLVRTLACHARGRRFEPVPGRHFHGAAALWICPDSSVGRAVD